MTFIEQNDPENLVIKYFQQDWKAGCPIYSCITKNKAQVYGRITLPIHVL